MRRVLLVICPVVFLVGCGQGDDADLRQFMEEAGRNAVTKIEPLPPILPQDTFVYRAEHLVDPFSAGAQKADAAEEGATGASNTVTDLSIEMLRFGGIIEKKGVRFALIVTPDNRVHLVKKGDRIGTGKGVVGSIDDKGVNITERVLAGSGKWIETTTRLSKQQPTAQN